MKSAEPILGIPDTALSGVSNPGFVDAGQTVEVEHTFQREGVIRNLYAKAYPGQELDVEYHLELVKASSENTINLFQEASDGNSTTYLVGDDQEWSFASRREFDVDDKLVFRFVNNDGTNAQPVHALVGVDYEGFFESVAQQIIQSIEGVTD